MKTTFWIALSALWILAVGEATAEEVGKAPAKEAMCQTCHGKYGAKPILPTYPKLNGQNKAYLIESLKAYKNGKRTGGLTAVMTAQAAMLTDAEMTELAEYYANQK